MPVIETTMIAGYGPDVKQRLVRAFTRGVLSVMAANMDGVIVILREVEPSNWARGGVSRIPGPALPDAIAVATAYLDAMHNGDTDAAADYAGPDLDTPALTPITGATYDEAYTDNGSLIFVEGTGADGGCVLTRLHVVKGKVLACQIYTGVSAAR